jgi:hypothetical protein
LTGKLPYRPGMDRRRFLLTSGPVRSQRRSPPGRSRQDSDPGSDFSTRPRRGDQRLPSVKTCAGVGFRAVVRPNVVGRVDIGFGKEGPAIFATLGYPF